MVLLRLIVVTFMHHVDILQPYGIGVSSFRAQCFLYHVGLGLGPETHRDKAICSTTISGLHVILISYQIWYDYCTCKIILCTQREGWLEIQLGFSAGNWAAEIDCKTKYCKKRTFCSRLC